MSFRSARITIESFGRRCGSDGRRAPAPRPGRLQVAAGSGWYRELWPVPGSGHWLAACQWLRVRAC